MAKTLNKRQRWVVLAALMLVVMMVLVPPKERLTSFGMASAGYSPIWKVEHHHAVNIVGLAAQCLIVGLLALGVAVLVDKE